MTTLCRKNALSAPVTVRISDTLVRHDEGKGMPQLYRLLILLLALNGGPAAAEPQNAAMDEFTEFVRSNPVTEGGVWLRMRNVLGEWERVMLIFGYADPGDLSACQRILEMAEDENPGRDYVCDLVQ